MSKDNTDSLLSELTQAKNNISKVINNFDELNKQQDRITELTKLKQEAKELEKIEYNSLPWYSKCLRIVSDLKYVFVTNEDKFTRQKIDENKKIFYDIDQNLINAANQSQPLARILAQEIDQNLDSLNKKKNLDSDQITKIMELNKKFNKWATEQKSIKIYKHKDVASADPLDNQLSELRQIQNNMHQFLSNNARTTELVNLAHEVGLIKETVPLTFFEKLSKAWNKVTFLFKQDSVTKLLKNTERNAETFAVIEQKLKRAGRNLETAVNRDFELTQGRVDKLDKSSGHSLQKSGNKTLHNQSIELNNAEKINSDHASARTNNNRLNSQNAPIDTNNINISALPPLSSQQVFNDSIKNTVQSTPTPPTTPRSSQNFSESKVVDVNNTIQDTTIPPPPPLPKTKTNTNNLQKENDKVLDVPAPTPPTTPRSSQNFSESKVVDVNNTIQDTTIPPPPPLPPLPSLPISKNKPNVDQTDKNTLPTASDQGRDKLLESIRGGAKLKKVENISDREGPKISGDEKNKESSSDLAAILARAMGARRAVIADDDVPENDDWGINTEKSAKNNLNKKSLDNQPVISSNDSKSTTSVVGRHTKEETEKRNSATFNKNDKGRS